MVKPQQRLLFPSTVDGWPDLGHGTLIYKPRTLDPQKPYTRDPDAAARELPTHVWPAAWPPSGR